MHPSGHPGLALLTLLALLAVVGPAAAYGERAFSANQQSSAQFYIISSTQAAAQSFQPTESFLLYNVTLDVENLNDAPLNVTIRADSGGEPAPTAMAGSERLGGSRAWLDFPMSPRPTLLAGVTYWIVADVQPLLKSYHWQHAVGDVVPGVAKLFNGVTSQWATQTADLAFVTFGLRLEPGIAVGLAADRISVMPGGPFAYTVHLNNTGSRDTPNAWVNLTLPPSVTAVSDDAAAIGGASTGPNAWRFTGLTNGPHAFTVNASVDANAPGGAPLTATVHLDHTDSSGASQPSSTATATVVVSLKPKSMYLVYDGTVGSADEMNPALPTNTSSGPVADFDGDGNDGTTIGGPNVRWTLLPPFVKAFRIRGAVSVEAFLNGPSGAGSSAVVNASLYDRRGVSVTLVASADVSVTVDGLNGSFEVKSLDLGLADHVFSAGNSTELVLWKKSGDDLWIAYDRVDVPSRVVATTSTYISIDRAGLFDARGPATRFSPKDVVRIEANVSDPFGVSEIAGVRVNLTTPDGGLAVVDAPLSVVATDPLGVWRQFSFSFANPAIAGTYRVLLTAREGNGVETSVAAAFPVEFPILGLAVSSDVPEPVVGGVVTFTVTYSNIGTAPAPRVWLNVTFPAGLAFVSDSPSGGKVGASNWSFSDVAPGFHSLNIVTQAGTPPANGRLLVAFALDYADGKGFTWSAFPRATELRVVVPPPPPILANPFVLFLLGAAVVGSLGGGYWVWRSLQPAIEEAFLIHRDGVLLYHVSRNLEVEGEKDRDILGAMLTAVQDFVKDSFKYGEKRDLQKIEFGDHVVVIDRGDHVFLAVVLAGADHVADIRRKTRRVLDEVEEKYGPELADWSGDMERILGVRDIVRRLVGRG